MKIAPKLIALTAIFLAATVAQAQMQTAAPAPAGYTATATATTGNPPAIGAEDAVAAPAQPDAGTMPATGGAPLAMLLGGSLTAASAFFLRRKISLA